MSVQWKSSSVKQWITLFSNRLPPLTALVSLPTLFFRLTSRLASAGSSPYQQQPQNQSPTLSNHKNNPSSSSFNSHFPSVKAINPQFDSSVEGKPQLHSPSDEDPNDQQQALNPKLRSGSGSSVSKSSNSSAGNGNFSPLKENPDGKMGSKPKSRSGSFLSPSDSPIFFDSPSPPKKTGCFWCSPKRVSRKNSKEIGVDVDWGRNGEGFLSDLNIFSAKEQQKILKKAMKVEEKINREAEKIVTWAKQGSARINISDIEDELSDNENTK